MQTFLPYQDFKLSAQCLDYRRLGKQRVEAFQLLKALKDPTSSGWSKHPATKMWIGYENALSVYMNICILEWKNRGYQNSMLYELDGLMDQASVIVPLWIGDQNFHRSHQSNLVRKLPSHYRQYFPDIADNLPYIWPIRK